MDFRNKGIWARTYQIWDDHIKKENNIRLKWNKSYDRISNMFPNSENLGWRAKFDHFEHENFVDVNKFRRPQIHQPNKKQRADYSREVNEYLEKLGIKEEKSRQLKPITMYEPTKEENKILYDGISKDNEGRYRYLNERKITRFLRLIKGFY